MDKQINKMIPLGFDLKTAGYSGYFILLSIAATIVFHLKLMGGSETKIISLQSTLFIISVIGILVWILHAYMDIVNTESKELILSLPINGFAFVFLRVLRLFALYAIFFLVLLFIISAKSGGAGLEYGIVDMFLIAGALFFMSGLGLIVLLISKHMVIGYGIPILWVAISFFYRGGASWLWHTCQWIVPKPFESSWRYAIAHWITGLLFHIISTFIIKQREYLIK